jgi:hypothetical protein
MNYILQTAACIKRNNRLVLLFLAFVIITWMEVISAEKAVIPRLLSNPLYDEFSEEDINNIREQRYLSSLLLLFLYFIKIAYVAFVLYIGNYYINSINKQRYSKWFKIAFFAESYYLVYRLYLVAIKFFEFDVPSWDIKQSFSLLRILNMSDLGIFADLLYIPLASINVISAIYCILLVYILSRNLKMKFLSSLKYVLCTYVLTSFVLMCLISLILFINV